MLKPDLQRWRRAPRFSPLSLLTHHALVVDIPSGYPEVFGTVMGDSETPDIADIYGDFNVDVTHLASVSVSGVDATSGPDLSVAASISADPSAC